MIIISTIRMLTIITVLTITGIAHGTATGVGTVITIHIM